MIIPAANIGDLTELPEHVRNKVEIVPAKTMREVLAVALVKAPRRPSGIPPRTPSRARGPAARA